jgi:hypothetical protein
VTEIPSNELESQYGREKGPNAPIFVQGRMHKGSERFGQNIGFGRLTRQRVAAAGTRRVTREAFGGLRVLTFM